jgi:hypothetical protein
MTRTAVLASLVLGAALALPVSGAPPAPGTQPSVEELKRLVEQREQELGAAQVALALARARLAGAEGKAEVAAAEWRKVLRHAEGRLKAVQDLIAQGRICSDESLRHAQGETAVARAGLAEAEGRRDDLRAEMPKVIAYHEWRIQRYQSLLQHKAIAEGDAQEALKEFGEELRRARDRLAGLRGDPAGPDKTGNGSKP